MWKEVFQRVNTEVKTEKNTLWIKNAAQQYTFSLQRDLR